MKELYIEAHEELIEQRMADWEEAHPNATDEEWGNAEARFYDSTADAAYGQMQDKLADKIDHVRQMRKDGMI